MNNFANWLEKSAWGLCALEDVRKSCANWHWLESNPFKNLLLCKGCTWRKYDYTLQTPPRHWLFEKIHLLTKLRVFYLVIEKEKNKGGSIDYRHHLVTAQHNCEEISWRRRKKSLPQGQQKSRPGYTGKMTKVGIRLLTDYTLISTQNLCTCGNWHNLR